MSEIRLDPLTGQRVIVAQNRAARPEEFSVHSSAPERCPFCPGHEEDTPPASAIYGESESATWRVRVFPNKFPAVTPPESGVHEVIVDSPEHATEFPHLPPQQAAWLFTAYRDRLRYWRQSSAWKYGQIFKNRGAEAGASLAHPHSQLVALPFVPSRVGQELSGARLHHQQHGRCYYCETIERELRERKRHVAETGSYLAFCPYAGRFPYETWITPRQHQARFEELADEVIEELGELTQNVLRSLERATEGAAYNFYLWNAPWAEDVEAFSHWRLVIFPRLSKAAGFEWGAGEHISTVAPEEAAAELRSV